MNNETPKIEFQILAQLYAQRARHRALIAYLASAMDQKQRDTFVQALEHSFQTNLERLVLDLGDRHPEVSESIRDILKDSGANDNPI
ncbi:MAG: hypothetical protein ABSA05_10680 [Opitutaceae bacterium]|jgi:hypothetical protein